MMTDKTRKDALTALRDKVQDGHPWSDDWPVLAGISKHGTLIRRSHHGDLNAAEALHDAVLQGWFWEVSNVATCEVERVKDGVKFEAMSAMGMPARAWLLAILSALIAMEDGA